MGGHGSPGGQPHWRWRELCRWVDPHGRVRPGPRLARTSRARPHRARRQHARRADAAVQSLRDAAGDALSGAAPDGAQPGLERRHGGAAAAAAELRRPRPRISTGRRPTSSSLLRPQRVVRRRGRAARSSSRIWTPTSARNLAAQYNGTSAPRLVLVSPIAHERLARLPRVDVDARNRELARYTEAMRRIAGAAGRDVCRSVHADAGADGARAQPALTINGIHLNEDGDRIVAQLLMAALGFDKGLRPAADGRHEAARRPARGRSATRTSSSSIAGVPSTPNTSSAAAWSRSDRSTSPAR